MRPLIRLVDWQAEFDASLRARLAGPVAAREEEAGAADAAGGGGLPGAVEEALAARLEGSMGGVGAGGAERKWGSRFRFMRNVVKQEGGN